MVATLELGNDSTVAQRAAGQRRLDGGDLWVKVRQPDRNDTVILGRHGFHRAGAVTELPPGTRLRWGLNLSWSESGATFENTGRYVVRAIYDAGTGPIESNSHTITVVPPWLRGIGPPDRVTRAQIGKALARTGDAPGDCSALALESYRDTVGTGTVMCQLALLAAALHKPTVSDSARARSQLMLGHAIARFGAEEIAVLITALFPYSGRIRTALCAAFERALEEEGVTTAAPARAIVRGEAFFPSTLRMPRNVTPLTLTRH